MFLLDEVQIEEVEDEGFIDGFGEREIEGVKGFNDGELGLGDTGFNQTLLSLGDLLRG